MSGSETVATPAEIADRVDERQQRLSRARTLWLTVGAAGGAFALSAGLSALFATDTRLLLGEWIALVLFAASRTVKKDVEKLQAWMRNEDAAIKAS